MAKSENKTQVFAEGEVAVSVIRPWKYGQHVIPAGDDKKSVVVELPEKLARQLITEKKVKLTAKNKNFDLPKRAIKNPE